MHMVDFNCLHHIPITSFLTNFASIYFHPQTQQDIQVPPL